MYFLYKWCLCENVNFFHHFTFLSTSFRLLADRRWEIIDKEKPGNHDVLFVNDMVLLFPSPKKSTDYPLTHNHFLSTNYYRGTSFDFS